MTIVRHHRRPSLAAWKPGRCALFTWALLAILAVPTPGGASPIGLSTSALLVYSTGGELCSASGSESATCDSSVTSFVRGFPVTGTLHAEAAAAFGSLTARASLSFMGAPLQSGLAKATAEFRDELRVDGRTGTGFVQYLFTGELQSFTDPPGTGSGFLFSHAGSPLQGIQARGIQRIMQSFEYESARLPFEWGTPFPLFVYAQGSGFMGAGDSGAGGLGSVALVGLRVYDADQLPVTDFSLFSAANASYPTSAAVPEPATWLLLASGLSMVLVRRLIRRRPPSKNGGGPANSGDGDASRC